MVSSYKLIEVVSSRASTINERLIISSPKMLNHFACKLFKNKVKYETEEVGWDNGHILTNYLMCQFMNV